MALVDSLVLVDLAELRAFLDLAVTLELAAPQVHQPQVLAVTRV